MSSSSSPLSSIALFFFLMIRRPPRSPLFPHPPLSRSPQRPPSAAAAARRSCRSADRPCARATLARLLVAGGEFLHLWPQHQRPHRHASDPRQQPKEIGRAHV